MKVRYRIDLIAHWFDTINNIEYRVLVFDEDEFRSFYNLKNNEEIEYIKEWDSYYWFSHQQLLNTRIVCFFKNVRYEKGKSIELLPNEDKLEYERET